MLLANASESWKSEGMKMASSKLHIEYILLLLILLVNTPSMGSLGSAFGVLIRGSEFITGKNVRPWSQGNRMGMYICGAST